MSDKGFNYCMKEETRAAGPWEFGVRPIERNSSTDWDFVRKCAMKGDFDKIDSQIFIKHYRTL